MKPGSIIVLIIAVVLVIAGVVTCLAGASMAKNNGREQELFTQYRDGMTYCRRDFKSSDVTRIEIKATDAKINITGGAPTSYVEVKNYDPSRDTLTINQSSVRIEESTGESAMKFWENGFSFFKGFRNLFNSLTSKKSSGEKEINVYLGDKTSVSVIDIETKNCSVSVDGIAVTDKFKTTSEKCVLSVRNSIAAAAVSVESASAKIELDSVTSELLDVKSSDEIDLVTVGCSFKNTAVTVKDGKIDLQNVPGGEKTAYDISSKSGTVTVDGVRAEGGFKKTPEESDALIKISAESAQITYTNTAPDETPDPVETPAPENNG